MDGFKNPFDEQQAEQMISIAEPPTPEQKKQEKKKQKQKQQPKKQQIPKLEEQPIKMIDNRQQGIIQANFENDETIFMSRQDAFSSKGTLIYEQPPLLEDIGVEPQLIADKMMSIIKFEKPSIRYAEQSDLSGPILIGFLLGLLLLLSGKMHFGDIYALFVIGNLLVFVLVNLMSQTQIISLYNVMSTLGYCLLPMLFLGFIGIFFRLQNSIGIILSLGSSAWSAYSATQYVELLMKTTNNDRKILIAYPLYLYYVSFAMITIF